MVLVEEAAAGGEARSGGAALVAGTRSFLPEEGEAAFFFFSAWKQKEQGVMSSQFNQEVAEEPITNSFRLEEHSEKSH